LRSLFGDIDFCECRHCRSVLGPAAYLADLLHFLESLPISNSAGKTALDGISARRPDLLHLELSCENTNTEIPYVDLVLEVLENAVAVPVAIVTVQALSPGGGGGLIRLGSPPPPPSAPTAVATEFREGESLKLSELPEKVRLALQETAITLGEVFSVKRTKNDAQTHQSVWVVSDGSRRWEIAYLAEHFRVWESLPAGPQTFDLPALSAFPEIETEFQRGYLHTDLIKALAPEVLFPVTTVSNIAPAVVPSGRIGGRAGINREVAIELPPGSLGL